MRIHPRPLIRCFMRLTAVVSAIGSKAAIAIMVVVGLLSIPVECSVAMGPHTIFVSADAVAALQNDSRHAHAGHGAHAAPEGVETSSAATTSGKTSHRAHGASMTQQAEATRDVGRQVPANAPASDDASAGLRTINVPARPAGISADAVVALDIPGGQPELLGFVHDVQGGVAFTIPPDRLLTGPEPPPP